MMLRMVATGSPAVAAAVRAPMRAMVAASSRSLSSLKPLDEEYMGTPNTMPTEASVAVTKVSTLSNGAKVVTREASQLGASVGIVVESGSRDESAAQAGASLHLEGMAYKLTQERSSIRLMRDVELAGGNLAACRGREKMLYVSECPPHSAATVLSALAETAVSPKIVPWEVADATAKLEQIILARHDESTVDQVDEALHSAAFGDSASLGKPLTPGPCKLSANGIKDFRDARFKGPSMTVVGVNVPHDDLKSQAEAALSGADSSSPAARPAAKYLGGEVRVKSDAPATSVSIAFAAPSGSDSSAPAYEVLSALLNTRATAAAPGASAFNVAYSDAGLVGVTGTCRNADAAALTHALASCFADLAKGPSDAEIESAIASAKISRGLRMEKPLYALLTLAEAASTGSDPTKVATALDGVSASDVKKAAAAAMKSSISVAAVGNVAEVPIKQDITALF